MVRTVTASGVTTPRVVAARFPAAAAAAALAAAAAGLAALCLLVGTSGGHGVYLFELIAVLSVGCGCVYVLWLTPPAYTLSLAIVLLPFSGNWGAIGLPEGVAPDRIVAAIGVLAVLLRAPGLPAGRTARLRPVHAVLAFAVLFVLASAAVAGTLLEPTADFNLLDAFGVIPF